MLTKVDFRFLIIAKASIEYEYLSVSGTSALKQGGSITMTSPTDSVVTLNILEQHFELMKKGRIQQQDQKMARKARKAAQLTGPPLSKSSHSNASSATFAANDDRQSGADAGASKSQSIAVEKAGKQRAQLQRAKGKDKAARAEGTLYAYHFEHAILRLHACHLHAPLDTLHYYDYPFNFR